MKSKDATIIDPDDNYDNSEYYRYKLDQLDTLLEPYQTTPPHPQYQQALNSYTNARNYWQALLDGNEELAEQNYNWSLTSNFLSTSLGSWILFTD